MKLNINLFFAAILLFTGSVLTSCKKDDEAEISGTGSMEMEFENRVGNQSLVLNTQTYQNANGDDFTISTFKYYVSNVTLIKADGSNVAVPKSYYLMDAADASTRVQSIENIPAGDYTSIKFTIGVDSTRNFAGAQTGALDPAKGMFWTWNSGYIFVKFEEPLQNQQQPTRKLFFISEEQKHQPTLSVP